MPHAYRVTVAMSQVKSGVLLPVAVSPCVAVDGEAEHPNLVGNEVAEHPCCR